MSVGMPIITKFYNLNFLVSALFQNLILDSILNKQSLLNELMVNEWLGWEI